MKRYLFIVQILLTALCLADASAQEANELYLIDVHSQLPRGQDENEIIALMDQAGVRHTILSARNDRAPEEVASFAAKHPERITAAVRSKGKDFNDNTPKFLKMLNMQANNPVFKAMGESILYHAAKGKKAPKIVVAADSPQNQQLLSVALEKGWPFIAHYEFKATGFDKSDYMADFEAMARAHPGHPFALIHMGQLEPDEVAGLIERHANVYFLTSHSNPITKAESAGQPWINLFEGNRLAPAWAELMTKHPDRFILAFDNVWPEHWGNFYLEQVALWRNALADLPPEVAHAIAHRNAEKLWSLPAN